MKRDTFFRLLAIGATGGLYPLCFPNFDLGWLAFFILVPLHLAIDNLKLRQAFLWGWLAGVIAFIGIMSWVITAMNLYGKVPLFISTLLMLLLATYLGLYVGLYTLGVTWIQNSWPKAIVIGGPCLWVALELLRTYFLSGLPWGLLGYSQYQWLTIIQFADLTGVYGVSFLIVLINTALTSIILWGFKHGSLPQATPFPWQALTTAVVSFGLVFAYGTWHLHTPSSSALKTRALNIGVVQASIDQAHKWDTAYRQETLNRYADLSKQAANNIDLLIWPEAATPFLFEREPAYQGEVLQVTRDAQSPLLFGSPTLRREKNGSPYLLNSAYLLTSSGQIAGRYDKRHLVPFGEYIPLKTLLFFLDKLVAGIGDFKPGIGQLTLALPQDPQRAEVRFGVAICFEVIFPDEVRQMAKEGAELSCYHYERCLVRGFASPLSTFRHGRLSSSRKPNRFCPSSQYRHFWICRTEWSHFVDNSDIFPSCHY